MWGRDSHDCGYGYYSGEVCMICSKGPMLTLQQDVFVIPDGAPGALAELERRKFTAEEGVRRTLLVQLLYAHRRPFHRIT